MLPNFNAEGILPPFYGGTITTGSSHSPYDTKAVQVVQTLCTSDTRRKIAAGWLGHREGLRQAGVTEGFQWIGGSYLENREPRDIDVVTFFNATEVASQVGLNKSEFMTQHRHLFFTSETKARFLVDAYFVDTSLPFAAALKQSAFWLNLFSHQRGTRLWKGMLKVDLVQGSAHDLDATDLLEALSAEET